MPTWIGVFSGWLYLAYMTVMLLTVLMRRRTAQSALGWSLAIILLPVLGSILFLIFGVRRVPRRLRSRIEHRQTFGDTTDVGRRGYQAKPPAASAFGHIGRMVANLGEGPRRTGNRTTIFRQGADAYESVAEAVRGAKHHIHVEVYIFRDDDVGQHFLRLLERKLNEGVQVRLIMDAVGTFAPRRILRRLRRAGGEGFSFLPLGLLGRRASINLRNHRKIVVCDGRVGFVGGLNVGEEYLGEAGKKRAGWYDLHMRVEGPSVRDVQRVFVEDWHFGTDEVLEADAYFPKARWEGDETMQLVSGGPDRDPNPLHCAILSAITTARRRLWIATPYLVPDRPLMDALRIAASCGVDVQIVTPRPPADHRWVAAAGLWHAEELLEAGVKIHHYRHGMMHAKALLADDAFGMLGSANLDNRSMHLNFELMALLDSPRAVSALDGELTALIAASEPLRLETLRGFSWGRRFTIAAARLFSPIL